MSLFRFLGLLFGAPMLLLGAGWVTADVMSLIAFTLNRNLNAHVIWTFPLLTTCGVACVWLGYRLVFTKPTKPVLHLFRKPPASN